jgi:hypothetical protein
MLVPSGARLRYNPQLIRPPPQYKGADEIVTDLVAPTASVSGATKHDATQSRELSAVRIEADYSCGSSTCGGSIASMTSGTSSGGYRLEPA